MHITPFDFQSNSIKIGPAVSEITLDKHKDSKTKKMFCLCFNVVQIHTEHKIKKKHCYFEITGKHFYL